MHKKRKFRRIVWAVVFWTATVLAGAIGGLLRPERSYFVTNWPTWVATVDWLRNTSAASLPILTLVVAFSAERRRRLTSNPVAHAIKGVLDGIVGDYAPEAAALEQRVTLFKHTSWSWRLILQLKMPYSGALVPYERSGEFRLVSATCFYAPKDDPDKAEGFAGYVFKTALEQEVSGLPQMDSGSTSATIASYAEATKVSTSWVENKLKSGAILPKALWGIPIEVEGIWGVLLIDSREPQIPKQSQLGKIVRPYLACLSVLLKSKV